MEATKGVRHVVGEPHNHMGLKVFFHLDSILKIFLIFMESCTTFLTNAVHIVYNESLVKDLIDEPRHLSTNKPKYDVVLIDVLLNEIYLPLAHHIGAPVILVSSLLYAAPSAWNLNVPFHYFMNIFGYSNPTSMITRGISTASQIMGTIGNIGLSLRVNKLVRKYLPKSPPITQLIRNVSFMMSSTAHPVHRSLPTDPHLIDIGCAHCRAAKPLSKELEDVMQRSGDHGVIYFSMGSFVNFNSIPGDFKKKVINVLSRLPQTILCKGETNGTNFSNFYFSNWFQQQDLLAHPKLRLIISHGGMGTTLEASYHGCPILGFPFALDQYYNVYSIQRNGQGEYLNWRTFSEEDLFQTLTKMLNNTSYKETAMRISNQMKDVLDSPSAQAAYWTEYIIRHKGAHFLQNGGYHLSWYQYFLLDVFAVIFITLSIAITTSWLISKYIIYITKDAFKVEPTHNSQDALIWSRLYLQYRPYA